MFPSMFCHSIFSDTEIKTEPFPFNPSNKSDECCDDEISPITEPSLIIVSIMLYYYYSISLTLLLNHCFRMRICPKIKNQSSRNAKFVGKCYLPLPVIMFI